MASPVGLGIAALQAGYRDGSLRLEDVLAAAAEAALRAEEHGAWIRRLPPEEIAAHAERIAGHAPASLPLWGVPFAIKDNIDLAGCPTTAACPAFAYTPEASAPVVQRLLDAGAIPLGKTNLDQFATGLVGTRSPFGEMANAHDPAYVAGGSSGGSALAVALGACSFALGTDTAGSGRVPAAFQGLVGLKPTRGWWSTRGVVPACRSLDCVSVFARSAADARLVAQLAGGFDADDPFSRAPGFRGFDPERPRLGAIAGDDLAACDPAHRQAYEAFLASLEGDARVVDARPLLEAARLLYEGPWIAERTAVLGDFLDAHADDVHPVTREILAKGRAPSAVDLFRGQVTLAEHRREAEALFAAIDVLVLPTAPCLPTRAAVAADPLGVNARLGTYTNFVNLLDLCALAIPAGTVGGSGSDAQLPAGGSPQLPAGGSAQLPAGGSAQLPAGGSAQLPFGVTLVAPAGRDFALLALAARLLGEERPAGPAPGEMQLAVCGAHLSGQPLNAQLTERGGYRVYAGHTRPCYRLYALPDGRRPALVRDPQVRSAIEVEVWSLPESEVGGFLRGVGPPLGLGSVELEDGRCVHGFIAEPEALRGATEITRFGGWRAWLERPQ